MSRADNDRDEDFNRASSALNEGLKSCRAVVDNYRAMITGDCESPANENEPETN